MIVHRSKTRGEIRFMIPQDLQIASGSLSLLFAVRIEYCAVLLLGETKTQG